MKTWWQTSEWQTKCQWRTEKKVMLHCPCLILANPTWPQSKPDMGVKLGHWPGKYSWPDTVTQHTMDSRTRMFMVGDGLIRQRVFLRLTGCSLASHNGSCARHCLRRQSALQSHGTDQQTEGWLISQNLRYDLRLVSCQIRKRPTRWFVKIYSNLPLLIQAAQN